MKTILQMIQESRIDECGGGANMYNKCGMSFNPHVDDYNFDYGFAKSIAKHANYRQKVKDHKYLDVLKKFEDTMVSLAGDKDKAKISDFIDNLDKFLKENK